MCTHITQFTWYVYTHHTVHLVCLPHMDLPQESHKKVCVVVYTHHTVHLVCVYTSRSSLGLSAPH